MLSIKRIQVERDVMIGGLFEEMQFLKEDAVMQNEFEIAVLTHEGFKRIEALRCSERLHTITLLAGKHALVGARKHLVLTKNSMTDVVAWKHLEDITEVDLAMTKDGFIEAMIIDKSSRPQVLFDLQVAEVHAFYTNDILSHNSHMLVQLGANAMRVGKNVLHYTFELRENKVATRYDSNFTNVSATDVPDEKELVTKKLRDMRQSLGRLIIKEYPTNTATVLTLKSHIEKIAITKAFRPDVVIIDYADIMRSTRQFDSLRHELKLVYEELRGLAMEMGIPIITASQTNRESTDSDVVGLDKISESFGKAMVCDVIITISRKPLQKSKGLCNIFVAKNRLGKDGVLFPAKIDTARSIIEILDHEIDLEEFQKTNDNDMKQLLREKWAEVGAEKSIELLAVDMGVGE